MILLFLTTTLVFQFLIGQKIIMSYSNSKSPYSKPSSYINLNSFNYSSDPVDSLDSILQQKWQIKSLEISSHGNNGVIFIETSLGSFVLKTNNQSPADLFFNKFAILLDVNVPQIRVIPCYDDFFVQLVFQIEKFCQKDEALSARLRKRMDFPFYQIMEYIPSISFLQVGPQRFQKHQLSSQKLYSMGICLGFDLIINNNDRFKLSKIWSSGNEGNIANILIKISNHFSTDREKIKNRQDLTTKLGNYYFIDHSGFLLDIEKSKVAADNFGKYMQRVVVFHDQIIQFLRKQLPCPQTFNGLISQIEFYTKYSLKQDDIIRIVEGIIYSTTMFIDFFEQKTIHEIRQQLFRDDKSPNLRSEVKYWNEYWNSDLAKIKLKHLEIYHVKVSSIYATYGQIIKDLCEKVAQKITVSKNNQTKIPNPSRKNSQRPESKHSHISAGSKNSHKSKATHQQNLKQLQNVLGSNQTVDNKDIMSNKQLRREGQSPKKEQPPKEQTKNKLKQRLEKYLKKNYDENYQRNNKASKQNIQSMESFLSNDL